MARRCLPCLLTVSWPPCCGPVHPRLVTLIAAPDPVTTYEEWTLTCTLFPPPRRRPPHRFLYTGQGPELGSPPSEVSELLILADEFLVPGLRLRCEHVLGRQLRVDQLESAWNLAQALDLPVLATYCRHLVSRSVGYGGWLVQLGLGTSTTTSKTSTDPVFLSFGLLD